MQQQTCYAILCTFVHLNSARVVTSIGEIFTIQRRRLEYMQISFHHGAHNDQRRYSTLAKR